ncbi:hypothetical protein BCR36DRAFT_410414 [Piromyces finnis]|uniref:Coth-domain-containing protein n=1 Tax=Piromyces finnis TaxID=1754191 RepID=A0A1Y1VGE0_9FUNG|nr:hypothetical protein BCR36DRAFT_410414 [Piromyces finnis]|eukprot:ORX55494.1 hypothetical protein BCR36DRAFT_410414 [Piromyces finnis]
MLKHFVLLLVFLVSIAYSRTVHFKFLGFGEKAEVIVDNKKYSLTRTAGEPYFSAKVNVIPAGYFKYKYVLDNVEEDFERECPLEMTKTYIDFYGRKDTIKELGKFQYSENHWNRSIGKTNLFDDSYIPTIHITGNKTETFFHNPAISIKAEKVTVYLKDEKKAFTNVPLVAKNKDFEKFQIKMTLSKTANIHQRYLLKFRNGSEDPINLRQTIYGNINQAIGIPSIHSVMVRVYYNMKPAGFYTMQEEAVSESFLRAEFYGNAETETIDAPSSMGDAFDCSTGGDFEYKPYNMSYYDPFAQKIGKDKTKVVALTEAIEKLDTNNEEELAEFEKKWFDIDTFQKAMCMEYLTGDWDGYWFFTSNFVVYEDIKSSTENTFKFFYITQDHDETFGVGITDRINTVGYDFPKLSYTTMLNKTWHLDPFDADHRTLVDKFIASSPKLQQRFQNNLISIVQNIFNPVAFRKVVDTYYERYEPEVKWDYSFERPYRRTKMVPDWRYNDFLVAFENSLPGLPWGLYEWVKLRSEAIKNEFCISWEGDENPPDASCVPYKIPYLDDEKTTVVEEPTTTMLEETTTTNVEPTTTSLEETTTTNAEPTTTSLEETTTTNAEPTTTSLEETTTTAEPTTTSLEETTTTNAEPTTTKSTKTIPTSVGGFVDWFKNKKPSDFQNPKVKRTLQVQ